MIMKVNEIIDEMWDEVNDQEEEDTPDNTFYYYMDGRLKDTDYIQDPPEAYTGDLSAYYNHKGELVWVLTTGDGDGYIVESDARGTPRLVDLQPVGLEDPVIVVQAGSMSAFTPRNINTIIDNPKFLMLPNSVWEHEIDARRSIELAWFSPEFMNDNR